MVQEDLRQLGVGEVLAHVDVVGVRVLADRLVDAALSLLQCLVQRAPDEARVAQRLEVARKQRRDELALAEDAQEPTGGVDDRQRRGIGLDEPGDGIAQVRVLAQQRNLTANSAGDSLRTHLAPTI